MSSTRQRETLAVVCTTPVLCGIFLGLRIYARRIRGISLSWDDWLVIVAWLLALALVAPSWMYVKMLNMGMHYWDIPLQNIYPDHHSFYYVLVFFNLINTPIVPLCKSSIIALLLRIDSLKRPLRYFLYAVQIFNALFLIVPWVWMMFQCPFVSNTQSASRLGRVHCISRDKIGTLQLVNNCANLVTDILVFPVPFFLAADMFSATLQKRFRMLFGFAFILGGTICTVFKIKQIQGSRYTYDQDWMYKTITFTINHIENCVSIIIANVLTLRVIISQLKAKFKKPNSEAKASDPNGRRRSNIMLSLNTWHGTKTRSKTGFYERYDSEVGSNKQSSGSNSKMTDVKEVELTSLSSVKIR